MAKHSNKRDNSSKKFIILLLGLICICSIILFIKVKVTESTDNKKQEEISQVLDTIDVPNENVTKERTKRMLQVEALKKENGDIVGWLEIEGTNINYPVLKGQDNDYYLKHTYKKETNSSGSIFLDKDYNFILPSTNLLIYGHRNKQGLMFEDLIKYKDEAFYKEHQTIRFTTVIEDSTYEILSAFYSRVYYQDETNVFKYYKFINARNEDDYNKFISEAKKASIYDTGITAEYNTPLLTLSTCEYSQEDGRFAVVAKKIEQ